MKKILLLFLGLVCGTSAFTSFVGTTSQRYTYRGSSAHFSLTEDNDDDHHDDEMNDINMPSSASLSRRSAISKSVTAAAAAATAGITSIQSPQPAMAEITADSYWPLWTALPVAPFKRRRTIRYEVADGVYAFDQMIGIYYVHVPIRMTVSVVHQNDADKRGLVVFAPIAPTKECLALMQELIDKHGPVRDIILPSVAVEHKVNAGPFARQFPSANFYVTDKQYAFPLNLPNSFLGLPSWTKPLPRSSSQEGGDIWGGELEHEVITVKPGIGSMYQDVALLHKPSQTVMVCDAVFAVDGNGEPPKILTEEEEYVRALLWHARETKDEIVEDTPENRRKGWRRIVLLFNFFFPGSGRGDLGPGPIVEALKTPGYENGWGGWKPFTWGVDEERDYETFAANGKPTVLPIIQIILSRNPDEVRRWLDVVTKWDFNKVIPMHLDAPIAVGPQGLEDAFLFLNGRNQVRFCDEDVRFLRLAEDGPLNFSVYKTPLGTLKGDPCGLQKPSKN